ncbi:hypothetical protein [Paracoccus sp. R86501]|uniref:hypothetical protein n=1 Tax=Paracoccus sp. R86501 TaxID=3101711 RepID=UPI00366A66E8
MDRQNRLNPHPPEFDQFLYAPVGEDRNGQSVTVLSTLARLNLDPWTETAELVALGHDAARLRIGLLLARSWDVPALENDRAQMARNLSRLLPRNPQTQSIKRATSLITDGRWGNSGLIWLVPLLIFVMIRLAFVISSGSGE